MDIHILLPSIPVYKSFSFSLTAGTSEQKKRSPQDLLLSTADNPWGLRLLLVSCLHHRPGKKANHTASLIPCIQLSFIFPPSTYIQGRFPPVFSETGLVSLGLSFLPQSRVIGVFLVICTLPGDGPSCVHACVFLASPLHVCIPTPGAGGEPRTGSALKGGLFGVGVARGCGVAGGVI